MRHLDDEAVKLLEANDAATRAYFAAHLAQPCETCEEYLAKVEGPGLLGGMADAALVTRAGDAEAPLDEVGFRRVRRTAPARPAWRRRTMAFVGAMAAAVVAVVVVSQQTHDRAVTPPGIKGTAAALTLELEVLHQNAAGDVVRPEGPLPSSGSLIVRYYATERGSAWLFAKRGDRLETLGQFDIEPGAHPLKMKDGQVAALSLEGESGGLSLILVGAPGRAPTVDEAREEIENIGPSRLAKTRADVRVEPRR